MAINSGNDSANKRKPGQIPGGGSAAGTAGGNSPLAGGVGASKPVRRRTWLWYYLGACTALLILLLLLPTVVAHTPLCNWALRRALPINGSITAGSVSLGWFSTPQIHSLELRDSQQQTVLTAEKVTAPATLVNLLFGNLSGGTLQVEKPKLSLVLSSTGSNLEEMLSTLSSSSSSGGVDMTVVVTDGEAAVTDQPTKQTWHLSAMQATLATARKQALPARIELAAAVSDPQRPGTISLKFHAQPSAATSKEAFSPGGLGQTDGDLDLAATNFPLAIVDRLLARSMPGMHLAGSLGAKASAQWTNLSKVKLQCDATAAQLELASPWTGPDVLKLDSAHAVCQAARTERQFDVAQLVVESDVGHCTANTRLDLGDGGWTSLPAALWQQQGKLQGMVDVALLARRMPISLRVRPGTQITSGQVDFRLQSADGNSGKSWQAELQTNRLAADDQGRTITWDQPVHAVLLVHQTPQGLVVDQLLGEADFGKITATGTPSQLTLKINADLKQLADKLGQFVDLGGLALGGQTDGSLHWNHFDDGRFDASCDLQVKNMLVGVAGQKPWSDDTMHIAGTARGITDFAARSRIDAARLQLRSSVDQIEATLAAPLALAPLPVELPLQLQWQGRLDAVTHRLPVNVALPMLQPDGNYQLVAQITARKDALLVQQGRLAAGQGNLAGKDWKVVQPSADVSFSGRVDLATGQIDLATAKLAGLARWQSATALGLQIGPGELHTRLVDGVLQADPLEVTCNQGRLALAPRVQLSPGPVELKMSAGTLAQQVQFDPALCRSGMERVLPVLANVTQAQGVVSVQIQGARVPLLAPEKAEVAGQFIVHSAQLQPGPLVQQLSLLSTTPVSITQIKPGSVILFRITGGRVYHQGLEMQFTGMTVKTFGSVGFDDSLKMMAEVTVLPNLLANTPVGNATSNLPIQIPIGGTLNRPTIDQAEIARFGQTIFRQATQGVIRGEIGKQLDQFLSPRK